MNVYGIYIPDKPLSNFELLDYAKQLNIPNFRGVFMRDELPKTPWVNECGIVNFNTSSEPGSHWCCYEKNGDKKTYFDSYGQATLDEIRKYLGGKIFRNTDIVQKFDTQICGHLCLFVLKALSQGKSFREILDSLTTYGAGIQWTNTLANELHKPVRKKFLKRFVFVRHVDDIWGEMERI